MATFPSNPLQMGGFLAESVEMTKRSACTSERAENTR